MTAARLIRLAALLLAFAVALPALAQTGGPDPASSIAPAAGPVAAAAAAADDMSMVTAAQSMADAFRTKLMQRVAAIPALSDETEATLARNSPTGRADYFLWLVPWTLSFLALGYVIVATLFGRLIARPWFRRMLRPAPQGIGEKLPILVLRAALSTVTLILTVVVGFALGAAAFDAPENAAAQKTVVIVFAAFAASYVLIDLWRLILAPSLPAYRLTRFSTGAARRLLWWLSAASVIAIGAHAYAVWMAELGLNDDALAVVTIALTLVTVIVSLATVFANRAAVTAAILDGRPRHLATGPARVIAALWAPAATAYAVLAWLEMTYRLIAGQPYAVPPVLGAYTVLVTMIAVHGLVLFAIGRFFQRRRTLARLAAMSEDERAVFAAADPDGPPPPAPGPAVLTYEDLAVRVAGAMALYAGLWALLQIWQARKMSMVDAMLDNAGQIAVVLLLGYVAYQAARISIDQKIAAEGGAEAPEPGDEGGARGASRLATLLPLVRTGILVVIVGTVAAMVMVQLGINLAPLFAGAGVVGIAIGFGAQYLIRDIFSGVFFLIDDAFRRGEYIDVGSVKGTVETISIRSFQLRHHLGPLHTIPFGEIKTLTNYSRDWVIMKLPLRVTYDTDVEKVRKLVKALGQDLLKDPVIGDQFLQPLKSQGVIEMQDSAMIIRVKFMTKPGDQWLIRQRVYQEIRALFIREGIKFAHREVTVRLAETPDAPLTPAQREAVAAAAIDHEALEDWGAMPPAARAAGA